MSRLPGNVNISQNIQANIANSQNLEDADKEKGFRGRTACLQAFLETLVRVSTHTDNQTAVKWRLVFMLIISAAQTLSFLHFSNFTIYKELDFYTLTFYDTPKAFIHITNPQFKILTSLSIQHEEASDSTSTASRRNRLLWENGDIQTQQINSPLRFLTSAADPYPDLTQQQFGFNLTSSTSNSSSSSSSTDQKIKELGLTLIKQVAGQSCLLLFFIGISVIIVYFQTYGKRALVLFNPISRFWQNKLIGVVRFIVMIYNPILLSPLMQLALIGCELKESLPDFSYLQKLACVFGILNAILCTLFAWLIAGYCEQSIKLYNTDLFRFNKTLFHGLNILIKIISNILFCVDANAENTLDNIKVAQIVLVAVSILIDFVDVFFNFAFTNVVIINTSLILSAISMCYYITFIISDYQQVSSAKFGFLLLVIFTFVTSKLLIELHAHIRFKIMISSEEKEHLPQKQFQQLSDSQLRQRSILISMLYSHLDDGRLHRDSNEKMGIIALLSRHTSKCTKVDCFCTQFNGPLTFLKFTNYFNNLNIFVQTEFLQQYILQLINTSISSLRPFQRASHQIMFIQLVALLSDLNRCVHSLQLLQGFIAHAHIAEKEQKISFPFFQKQAALSLQYWIKHRMLDMFRTQNSEQQIDVSQQSEVFVDAVIRKNNIRLKMITALNAKIQFYNMILTGIYPLKTDILHQIRHLTYEFQNLQKEVIAFYTLYDTPGQMNTVVFFFAEIWNNLYAAYSFSKITTTFDQNYHKVLNESKIDLLSNKICYVKASFGNQIGKMHSYSINTPYVLNIDRQKLNQIKNVSELIPAPIDRAHNHIVSQFFETSGASIFRQLGKAFYKDNLGYAVPMSAFFDVDALDFSELTFFMFLHPEKYIKKQIVYLLFNASGNLESASPNVLSVLAQKRQSLVSFEQSSLKGLNWSQVVPNSSNFIEKLKKQGLNSSMTFYGAEVKLDSMNYSSYKNQDLTATVKIKNRSVDKTFSYFIFELSEIVHKYSEKETECQTNNDDDEPKVVSFQPSAAVDDNSLNGEAGDLNTTENQTTQKYISTKQIEIEKESKNQTSNSVEVAADENDNIIRINITSHDTSQNRKNSKVLVNFEHSESSPIQEQPKKGINQTNLQATNKQLDTSIKGHLQVAVAEHLSGQQNLHSQEFNTQQILLHTQVFSPKFTTSPTTASLNFFEQEQDHSFKHLKDSSRSNHALNPKSLNQIHFKRINTLQEIQADHTQNHTATLETDNNNNHVFSSNNFNHNTENNLSLLKGGLSSPNHNFNHSNTVHSTLPPLSTSRKQTSSQSLFHKDPKQAVPRRQSKMQSSSKLKSKYSRSNHNRNSIVQRNDDRDSDNQETFGASQEAEENKIKALRRKASASVWKLNEKSKQNPLARKSIRDNLLDKLNLEESSIKRASMEHLTRYKIISRFISSPSKPNSLLGFMFFRLAELVVLLVLVFVFLVEIQSQVYTLKDNASVLRFQSELLGPYDLISGLFWQGINSYYSLASKFSTTQTFLTDTSFVTIQETYEFSQFKNFTEGLYNYNGRIQDFLDSTTELQVTDFMKQKIKQNITNRSMILRVKNYLEKYIKLDWTKVKQINVYDVDMMFMQLNYAVISETLGSIGQISFANVKSSAADYKNIIGYEILFISLLVLCLSGFSLYFIIRYFSLKQKIFNLFVHCDRLWVEEEMIRAQCALTIIEKENQIDPMQNYSFAIEEKEEYFARIELSKEEIFKRYKAEKKLNNLKLEIPSILNKTLIFFIFLFIISCNLSCLIYVIIENGSFIDKYLSVSERYQLLADNYSLTSRLSSYRDYSYATDQGFFQYLSAGTINNTLSIFDKRLIQLKEFLASEILAVDQGVTASSLPEIQSYMQFIQVANSCNLCTDIVHFTGDYLKMCLKIQQNVLTKGLTSSLSSIVDNISNERKETNFKFKKRNPPFPAADVVETSVILSRILKYSSNLLYSGLQDVCVNSWQAILIVMSVYMGIMIIVNIGFLTFGYYNISRDFRLTKNSIQLIPMNALYLDNAFFTHLKIIYQENKLLTY